MRNYTIYTPNITMAMKSVINGWDRHHTGETRSAFKFSAKHLKGMFAQTEGYIKMDTEERGCEGAKWTHLPHARNQ
jgi:hypothetical protein